MLRVCTEKVKLIFNHFFLSNVVQIADSTIPSIHTHPARGARRVLLIAIRIIKKYLLLGVLQCLRQQSTRACLEPSLLLCVNLVCT
mmetsp:Transcript_15961/g.33942  ORF Transcript_15961/g.33942 Transcript_15961/m.33942 type:complete len:86 (-) Transcript_15961:322-579(-)